MIILRDDESAPGSDASAVAIGVFDGLHLGQQRVIGQVRSLASAHGARATIVTFDPHPALVLAPESAPLQLGTLEQRLEGFEALGVDAVARGVLVLSLPGAVGGLGHINRQAELFGHDVQARHVV